MRKISVVVVTAILLLLPVVVFAQLYHLELHQQTGNVYEYTMYNDSAASIGANSITVYWTGAGQLNYASLSGGCTSTTQTYYPSEPRNMATTWSGNCFTLPAGESTMISVGFNDSVTISNITINAFLIPTATPTPTDTPTITPTPEATGTPTPTPTNTPYGALTPTPTATATPTPRPDVEATAQLGMMGARDAISDTFGEIAPYDWQSGIEGRSDIATFPNLFDVISPNIAPIISYALALWQLVNANNVVMIIFMLSLGIGLLIWVIKLISGASGAGYQSANIRGIRRNPYNSTRRR